MHLSRTLLRTFSGFLFFLFLLLPSYVLAAEKHPPTDSHRLKVAFLVDESKKGIALSQAANLFLNEFLREGGNRLEPLFVSMGTSGNTCSFEELPEFLEEKGVAAAVSLLRGPGNSCFHEVGGRIQIPLLMAWSERIDLSGLRGDNLPLFFSLDFPESFRASAIALWAKCTEEQNWSIFMDHLDRRSKKMGKLTSDLFFAENIRYKSMEFLRNSRYDFINSSRECVCSGSENLLSWLAPSDTIKLQETLFSLGACRKRLVHGGQKEDMLLGNNGITVFSQDPFPEKEFTERIKDTFPQNLTDRISPSELIKVKAVLLWLYTAMSDLQDNAVTSADLVSSLEEVRSLSLPGFSVEFSRGLHRPVRKTIFILRSRNGLWVEEESLLMEASPDGTFSIAP